MLCYVYRYFSDDPFSQSIIHTFICIRQLGPYPQKKMHLHTLRDRLKRSRWAVNALVSTQASHVVLIRMQVETPQAALQWSSHSAAVTYRCSALEALYRTWKPTNQRRNSYRPIFRRSAIGTMLTSVCLSVRLSVTKYIVTTVSFQCCFSGHVGLRWLACFSATRCGVFKRLSFRQPTA